MKKSFVLAFAAIMPLAGFSQSAIDAMGVSQLQNRGTARFMAMGGAFTALGGDASVLTQNPGGLGLYRSSEVSLTLDLDLYRSSTKIGSYTDKDRDTRFMANNFAYVGSFYTGSEIHPYFNFGVSYNRLANLTHRFRSDGFGMNGSLTNYIAGSTQKSGWDAAYLNQTTGFNPYQETAAPWLSILAYNSYMINLPHPYDKSDGAVNNDYMGLWHDGLTSGMSTFDVLENGYVDEYNIDLGGNFSDVVYWGFGVGITDLNYSQSVYYTEDMEDADVTNATATGVESGAGGFSLNNRKQITGTGYNVKLGVVVKPVNELRLGFAVHTPTYYHLTQTGYASTEFGYDTGYNDQWRDTDNGYSSEVIWRLKSPWRLMAGIAGVIGGKGIISADYEYRPYNDMSMSGPGNGGYRNMNSDIETYYQASHILRLGAEYRMTPNWSVRAGYSYQTSPVTTTTRHDGETVYTSGANDVGTVPSYSLDNDRYDVSCGFGYRYKRFSIDFAYVYSHRSSDYHPYTVSDFTNDVHVASVKEQNHNIVLTAGIKF